MQKIVTNKMMKTFISVIAKNKLYVLSVTPNGDLLGSILNISNCIIIKQKSVVITKKWVLRFIGILKPVKIAR